jgi:hypothetical protein
MLNFVVVVVVWVAKLEQNVGFCKTDADLEQQSAAFRHQIVVCDWL